MTDLPALIRLQAWLSPAFPTGAFAYSHALEAAIRLDLVACKEELHDWLEWVSDNGPGWNDAVLLRASWQQAAKKGDLSKIAELAEAMAFSRERHLETMAQGTAFLKAASAWGAPATSSLPHSCALPVALGAVAAWNGIDLEAVLAAYLHAYISNQIQAALRLMPLGQTAGVELLAALERKIVTIAQKASQSSLDDLGSASFMADIASLQHETLDNRIFRS